MNTAFFPPMSKEPHQHMYQLPHLAVEMTFLNGLSWSQEFHTGQGHLDPNLLFARLCLILVISAQLQCIVSTFISGQVDLICMEIFNLIYFPTIYKLKTFVSEGFNYLSTWKVLLQICIICMKKWWKISLKKLKHFRNWLLDKNSWFFESDGVRPIDRLHANAEELIRLSEGRASDPPRPWSPPQAPNPQAAISLPPGWQKCGFLHNPWILEDTLDRTKPELLPPGVWGGKRREWLPDRSWIPDTLH